MAGNRFIIGSEADDTKKIELDRNGIKVVLPVSLYDSTGNIITTFGVSSSSSIGTGSGTVTTAGTAVRLSVSSVPCKRVYIFNREDNGSLTNNGILAVGDANVVATIASRRGAAVFPANSFVCNVTDLNLVWVDATDNGAKFSYYYEI